MIYSREEDARTKIRNVQNDRIFFNGSPYPALKRGRLHVGSVTQIGDSDASPKRGRLHVGIVTHAEAWTGPQMEE